MTEDLSSLKVGDKVVFYGCNSKRISTIDKITKTEIVIGNLKFRKSNGIQVGTDTWTNKCIGIASKEIIEKIEREQNIRDMRIYIEKCLDSLNYNQLEAIYKIIKDNKSK